MDASPRTDRFSGVDPGAAGANRLAPTDGPAAPPTTPLAARTPAATRRRRTALLMATSDAICAAAALAALGATGTLRATSGPAFALTIALAVVTWVLVFRLFSLYDVHRLSAFEEFRRTVSATTVGTTTIVLGAWWIDASTRVALGGILAIALVAELTVRRVWRWNLRRLRGNGYLALRTIIVGTNEEAARLAATICSPALGFVSVTHLRTHDRSVAPGIGSLSGDVARIEEAIEEHRTECVFVASTAVTPDEVARIAAACRRASIDVRVSANLADVLTSRVSILPIENVMTLSLRPVRLTGSRAALKRSFDVVIASFALLLLAPLMAAIAVVIAVTSGRPVLFRQERVTKDGRAFEMLKFRTMVDAAQRPSAAVIDLTAPFFKQEDDPRLTRVGRFLRSFSLDELPQLWHVVRGDLSLVGPRALWVEQVSSDASSEQMQLRHEVRAGLTGWWQVNGRNLVSPEEALRLDLFYINNWSIALDTYILIKTIGVVLGRRGAF